MTEHTRQSTGKHQHWSPFIEEFSHQEKSRKTQMFPLRAIMVAFIVVAVTFEVEVCCVVRVSETCFGVGVWAA